MLLGLPHSLYRKGSAAALQPQAESTSQSCFVPHSENEHFSGDVKPDKQRQALDLLFLVRKHFHSGMISASPALFKTRKEQLLLIS